MFADDALECCALRLQAERALEAEKSGQAPSPAERLIGLLHRWKSAWFPDTPEGLAASCLTSYTERDLLRMAQGAGFGKLRLELCIDLGTAAPTSWEVFLDIAPHPWAPSLRQILDERFLPDERQLLEAVLRPGVEAGQHTSVERMAYITGIRPSAQTG